MNKPTKKEEQPKAIKQIPDGWIQVNEGDSQIGDMVWAWTTQQFEEIEPMELDDWAGYFYCLIRRRK